MWVVKQASGAAHFRRVPELTFILPILQNAGIGIGRPTPELRYRVSEELTIDPERMSAVRCGRSRGRRE